MPTEQVLLRLPDDLVRRFKQVVPARERSTYVRKLLEQSLPPVDGDNDPLFLAALAVEQETGLGNEMAEWETATIGDGLTDLPTGKR
jgi:predicted transcriptional regulator